MRGDWMTGGTAKRRALISPAWVCAFFTVVFFAACSIDTDTDDGDDFRALTQQQKVQALSVYLPWANLREAADLAAEPNSSRASNTEAAALADEIRNLCQIRKSPQGAAAASKLARTETLEIGGSSAKSQCPISLSLRVTYTHSSKGPATSETLGTVDVRFTAQEAASVFTPITRLEYKGTTQASTAPEESGAELTHQLIEKFEGEIETRSTGRVPITYERDANSRFRGATSEVHDRIVRKGTFNGVSVEWRQERVLDDLKPREIKHFLNDEEIPTGEYEKLRHAARSPN